MVLSIPRTSSSELSNSSPLRRSAPIVRDRRCVANRRNADTGLVDRPNRRFSSSAGPLDADLYLAHPCIKRLPGSLGGRLLCGERRPFSRTPETASARRRLCNEISVGVRNRDHRVIERGRYMDDPDRNVLFFFLFVNLLLWCCHISFGGRRSAVGSKNANCRCRLLATSSRVPSS